MNPSAFTLQPFKGRPSNSALAFLALCSHEITPDAGFQFDHDSWVTQGQTQENLVRLWSRDSQLLLLTY